MQFYHEFVNFQIVHYLPNISTVIAIGLSSNHLWIFKLWVLRKIFPHSSHFQVFKWGVVRQFFPHSSQLICHPIICEFSKCALVAKSLQIHRNQSFSNHALFAKFFLNCRNLLVIQLFVNIQMRRCSPNLSTFIAIKLSEHRYNTLFPSLHGNWSKTDFFWWNALLTEIFNGKIFQG